MRKLDAFMMRQIREHQHGWRVGVSILYGVLLAWYLWDVVHQNTLWGIDFACAILMAAVWGLMAFGWGRVDRCDAVSELVVQTMGDSDVGNLAWLWTYKSAAWQQREILHWMETHDIAAVHVDDMPPAVRDLAKFLVLLRSS